jgi:hypothetical protein
MLMHAVVPPSCTVMLIYTMVVLACAQGSSEETSRPLGRCQPR